MAECGVYKITNTFTGRIYIGRSLDIPRRWREHINNLNNGKHINKKLQMDWNLLGEGAFEFEVVKYCDEKYLNYEELVEISKFPEDKRYNAKSWKDEFVMSILNEGFEKCKIDFKDERCRDKSPLNFNLVLRDKDLNQDCYVSIINCDFEVDKRKYEIKQDYVDAVGGNLTFLEHMADPNNKDERLFRLRPYRLDCISDLDEEILCN